MELLLCQQITTHGRLVSKFVQGTRHRRAVARKPRWQDGTRDTSKSCKSLGAVTAR